jgi:hypothetical protein
MIRKRHLCACGWNGRGDKLQNHKDKCTAGPKIEFLQKENAVLKARIEYLEEKESKSKTSNVTINNPVINNIQNNNITFYGNEEQPKALNEIRELCRRGNFVDCVPRYIEMKHFSEGKGNIRFEGKVLEVFKDNCWVEVPKDAELAQITEKNSQEVIERYSEKPIACTFKIWAGNNLKSQHSSGFQEVRQKVEDVILKNS